MSVDSEKLWMFKRVESEVTQSCLTLYDPMDCSLPGSSIHGIFQARILEWTAISFSRSSWPRDWTWVSHIVGRCFTVWDTREVHKRVERSSIWLSDKFSALHPGRPTHVNHILEIPFFGFPVGIAQPKAGASLLAQTKESAYNAGDPGSLPELGRSFGWRHGNPLQCSCLENSMDRGAWWATVHGVAKSQTQLRDWHEHEYEPDGGRTSVGWNNHFILSPVQGQ